MSGADAPVVNGNVMFCSCYTNLVNDLKAIGITNSDGTEIMEEI